VLFSEPKIPQSTRTGDTARVAPMRFQCSSASRKFLNPSRHSDVALPSCVSVLFSEPKIPQSLYLPLPLPMRLAFQCSSASRKFLNWLTMWRTRRSSSVSVLFSEPKIPQCKRCWLSWRSSRCFSALQRAENSSITCCVVDRRRRR